jgi:hypothetical protein
MMTLGPFNCGDHYRELSPAEGRYRWRWQLSQDLRIPLRFICPPFSCRNSDNWEWMRVEGGEQIVRAGYTWNGASPKRYSRILRRWVGVPDGPKNLRGTCSHDALYQASALMRFPISRRWADDLFGDILRADNFRWANLYQGAVEDFGAASWGVAHPGQHLTIL